MNPDDRTTVGQLVDRLHQLSPALRRGILAILLSLTLTLLPVNTFGWSATGHMTVAQIAYERLLPAAKKVGS